MKYRTHIDIASSHGDQFVTNKRQAIRTCRRLTREFSANNGNVYVRGDVQMIPSPGEGSFIYQCHCTNGKTVVVEEL